MIEKTGWLSAGARKVLLHLCRKQRTREMMMSRFPKTDYAKYGMRFNSLTLKSLKKSGIFSPGSKKIYPALNELQKAELITIFKDSYRTLPKPLRALFKRKKTHDPKRFRRILIKDLKQSIRKNDYSFDKKLLLPDGKHLDMNEIDRGIKIFQHEGMLTHPNQKFIQLTPDGWFLGRILERLNIIQS